MVRVAIQYLVPLLQQVEGEVEAAVLPANLLLVAALAAAAVAALAQLGALAIRLQSVRRKGIPVAPEIVQGRITAVRAAVVLRL